MKGSKISSGQSMENTDEPVYLSVPESKGGGPEKTQNQKVNVGRAESTMKVLLMAKPGIISTTKNNNGFRI